MKSRKHTLTILLILFVGIDIAHSQSSLNSSVGIATGAGGTASYSVGQVIYTTNYSTKISETQGVQQPYDWEILHCAGIPSSPNVKTGDQTISTQTQMDAFFNANAGTNFGNKWNKVIGDLVINGNSLTDPITSLCNLQSLTEVTGQILIQQFTKLGNPTTLDDLSNLSKVGRLTIITNPQFEKITLTNLVETSGSLMVRNNINVKSITFPELQNIGGSWLHIQRNHRAETIQFSSTAPNFNFTNSASSIDIQKNGDLASNPLSMDFKKITKVGKDLIFSQNSNSGISNFDNIFSALDSVKGNLTITENSYLSKCCIAASAVVVGNRTIYENTGNCADLTAVSADCGTLSKRTTKNLTHSSNNELLIDVYPNPSSGLFDVEVISETQGNLKLTVLDLLGRPVYKSTSEIQGFKYVSVDLNELSNSQYILKIEVGGNVQNRRIVVSR